MNAPDWIATGARISAGTARDIDPLARDLVRCADAAAATLAKALPSPAVVGLVADNSPHWLALDLALQSAGVTVVPLPVFFSREQMLHAVHACGMQALWTSDRTLAARLGFVDAICEHAGIVGVRHADAAGRRAPFAAEARIAKITFTSGTTGTPKGVMLTAEQQLHTARGLAALLAPLRIRRHLCLLPLPVLLENVAGAYTALLLGATCVCPPLAQTGLSGASGFDAARCLEAMTRHRPDSMILLPQMLHALVAALGAASRSTIDAATGAFAFVAVGGARTPPQLIVQARALGLPVYEGYGLTECASVVCVNVPGADRVGTVGRSLPGVDLHVASDGELKIAGRAFAGYLGAQTEPAAQPIASGDLGAIDGDGFVALVGRKKHVLVTSFGRNVSPEWPESLLLEHPRILQAVVLGDDRPHLVAVVVAPCASDTDIDAHIARVNARLPDYARIRGWVRASEPCSERNGLATGNGRIRRDAVLHRYANRLDALYAHAEPACALPDGTRTRARTRG